jgi:glycine/D-amino acid oxidase-like deaminating enzyme
VPFITHWHPATPWALIYTALDRYSETPDFVPIFGTTSPKSRVYYIMGCNAWGQAVFSSLGDIVPAAIGLRDYTAEEREIANLCVKTIECRL